MKKLLALPLSALMLLVLAACGGGGPVVQDATLDETVAQTFGSTYGSQAADYQMSLMTDPPKPDFGTMAIEAAGANLSPLAKSAIEALQDECVTTTGNDTDADNDGVPVNMTAVYDCHYSESGTSMDMTGSISYQDKDDGDEFSGYTLNMTNFDFSMSSGSDSFALSFDLNFDLTVSGTQYDADFDFAFSGNGSGTESFSMEYDFSQTYLADSAGDPFAAGTLTFSGSLTLEEGTSRYALTAGHNPALVYQRDGCTTGFSSGGLEFSDSEGNDVGIVYTCDSENITYNGSPL